MWQSCLFRSPNSSNVSQLPIAMILYIDKPANREMYFLGKTLGNLFAIYHAWGSEIDQIRMLADRWPPIPIKNVQLSKYQLVLSLIEVALWVST